MPRPPRPIKGLPPTGKQLYNMIWGSALMHGKWESPDLTQKDAINLRQSLNLYRKYNASPGMQMRLEEGDYRVKKVPHRGEPHEICRIIVEPMTNNATIGQRLAQERNEIENFLHSLDETVQGRSDGATHAEIARERTAEALQQSQSTRPKAGGEQGDDMHDPHDADPDATPTQTSADIFAQAVQAARKATSEDDDLR